MNFSRNHLHVLRTVWPSLLTESLGMSSTLKPLATNIIDRLVGDKCLFLTELIKVVFLWKKKRRVPCHNTAAKRMRMRQL